MKLEDLLKQIPESKIGMQFLSECMVSIKEKKRPHTHVEITFVSEAVTPMFALGKSDKLGIVLWIDRAAYQQALDAAKEAPAKQEVPASKALATVAHQLSNGNWPDELAGQRKWAGQRGWWLCVERLRALSKQYGPDAEPDVIDESVQLDAYDAGNLNDFGGGKVSWWHDYIRSELAKAHDHYQQQINGGEK